MEPLRIVVTPEQEKRWQETLDKLHANPPPPPKAIAYETFKSMCPVGTDFSKFEDTIGKATPCEHSGLPSCKTSIRWQIPLYDARTKLPTGSFITVEKQI
jgi:hypothetical protein